MEQAAAALPDCVSFSDSALIISAIGKARRAASDILARAVGWGAEMAFSRLTAAAVARAASDFGAATSGAAFTATSVNLLSTARKAMSSGPIS